MIYSIILFFILRKYFNDLKDKYALLLNATNQMAEGNLNVEVTDDLGVFNPFKKETGEDSGWLPESSRQRSEKPEDEDGN